MNNLHALELGIVDAIGEVARVSADDALRPLPVVSVVATITAENLAIEGHDVEVLVEGRIDGRAANAPADFIALSELMLLGVEACGASQDIVDAFSIVVAELVDSESQVDEHERVIRHRWAFSVRPA